MEDIPVEKIIRSRRRTIALEVTPAATLIVRAPLRASSAYIEEMIRQKSSWILRKIDEMKTAPGLHPVMSMPRGRCSSFSGGHTRCILWRGESMTIERSDRLYVSRTFMPDIRNQLKRWYMEEARKEIQARCMWFSMKTGHVPSINPYY